jgi:hypothetical protein
LGFVEISASRLFQQNGARSAELYLQYLHRKIPLMTMDIRRKIMNATPKLNMPAQSVISLNLPQKVLLLTAIKMLILVQGYSLHMIYYYTGNTHY